VKTLATKKKVTLNDYTLKANRNGTYTIKNTSQLLRALHEFDQVQTELEPLMRQATELKKAATYYAAKKRLDVVQLEGRYFRLISRTNRYWDAAELQKIIGNKTVKVKGKTKKLWQIVTKRVPDAELISEAIDKGYLDEDEIGVAFKESKQQPFLQRYEGKAE
jgi:hypothetical protein